MLEVADEAQGESAGIGGADFALEGGLGLAKLAADDGFATDGAAVAAAGQKAAKLV